MITGITFLVKYKIEDTFEMIKNTVVTTALLFFFTFINKVAFLLFNDATYSMTLTLDGMKALLWGMRFDLTAVVVLVTLCLLADALLYRFTAKNSLLGKLPIALAAVWISATSVADYMYFTEAGRHITFEVFIASGSELSLLTTALVEFTKEMVITSLLLLMFIFILKKVNFTKTENIDRRKSLTVLLILWPLITITSVRGGYSDSPQSPMSAFKIGNEYANIAWNATYSISYYLAKGDKKAAKKVTRDISESELEMYKSQLIHNTTNLNDLNKANVIFVLLESWVADDLFSYSGRNNAAPFFDQLRESSFTTQAMYANGFRTVEGMFASLCSYSNPIGGGVAGTQLQGLQYNCLPNILKKRGWNTSFIQGSGKGIVGSFAQALGFEHSFGKKDFDFEAQTNYWGYMDDGIYQFALNQIETMQSPYFMTINTGTTHDSYLPKEEDFIFGKQDRDSTRRSVTHYADKSLKKFVTQLKESITEPTLVVLLSDHTKDTPREGLKHVSLPFLMFAINAELPAVNKPVQASQRDIAPTILSWLGGSASWFSGQSLLSDKYTGGADFSNGTTYNWIKNNYYIEMQAGDNGRLDKCYKVLEDTTSIAPIDCQSDSLKKLQKDAARYMEYSQQRLFDGSTKQY